MDDAGSMGALLSSVSPGFVLGPALQAASMVGFALLGWLLPRREAQPLLHADLAFNLLNGLLLFPLRVTVVAAAAGALSLHLLPTGWLPGPWAQGLLSFVLLDLGRYWLHRAGHRVPWLWRFHRVHHGATRLDSTTGLRMHAADFLQLSALPILLFGVLLDTRAWSPWVLPAVLGVGVLFDGFQHANLRFPATGLGRLWGAVFNNPHFHSWHHTVEGHVVDGNYGNSLTIWDRLFGSDVTRLTLPEAFGVRSEDALENNPLGWQLLRAGTATSA